MIGTNEIYNAQLSVRNLKGKKTLCYLLLNAVWESECCHPYNSRRPLQEPWRVGLLYLKYLVQTREVLKPLSLPDKAYGGVAKG